VASPQKEQGFTTVANELLEQIIASGLNGTEISIVMLVIRKTYGWNKKQDEISLSQFCDHIPVSKTSICSALKNLQLVKILVLVKKGKSKLCSNTWQLNKDYDKWQLVKKTKLVKKTAATSKENFNKLVKKTLHTKESKESIQKKHINFSNDFEVFWKYYPRKEDKDESYIRYKEVLRIQDIKPEVLITASKNYNASSVGNERRYIKLAHTFLSRGGYKDWIDPEVTTKECKFSGMSTKNKTKEELRACGCKRCLDSLKHREKQGVSGG